MIPHGGEPTPEIVLQTVYDVLSAADAVTLPIDVAWVAEYHGYTGSEPVSDETTERAEPSTLAAALGRYVLECVGHTLSPQEREGPARLFALLLMAPPAVLDGYGVKTAQDIQWLTGLGAEDSQMAYGYLADHRRRQRTAALMAAMTERAKEQMSGRQWPYRRNVF